MNDQISHADRSSFYRRVTPYVGPWKIYSQTKELLEDGLTQEQALSAVVHLRPREGSILCVNPVDCTIEILESHVPISKLVQPKGTRNNGLLI